MVNDGKIRLLLIEDEEFDVKRVKNTIGIFKDNLIIDKIVSNGSDALSILKENPDYFDIIIMDYQIAGAIRGEELIKQIKKINYTIQIIVITKLTVNISDFDFAKRLVDAGAYWYCTKYPGDIEEYIYQPTDFLMSIFNAYEKKKLEMQNFITHKKLSKNIDDILSGKKIIGNSEFTLELIEKINKLANSDVNTLIVGPSGTGKELVANNIHYKSKRKFENFVPINCGSIPADLIESELFGYEKGAFTGAASSKQGLFEVANNGTIFLDEIAELPLNAQSKLLRVIQEGEIEKIGRTKKIKVDVRIIAATNKILEEEIKKNNFREDLYYRLNVVPVFIDPLVKRKDDIPLLLHYFVGFFGNQMGKPFITIEDDLVEELKNYQWPGNVRELKNVVQRLIFEAEGSITLEDYIKTQSGYLPENRSNKLFSFDSLKSVVNLKELETEFKAQYIKYVRDKSTSDAEAASKLGIAPPNFHRLCKDLGIK